MPLENKDSEPKPKWIGPGKKWDIEFDHWSCPEDYEIGVTNHDGGDWYIYCLHVTIPESPTIHVKGSE